MAQAGYTPIQLYYSTTASAAPSSGNLANGELAINITDGKLYYKDNGGTVRVLAGTGGTGVVAGSNTQVQFNNNGVFGASSGLTWDGTNLTASQLRSSGLTSGRVTYASTSGLLVDSANMTFNGTRLTVADLADSGLTSGRVVYSTAGGALVDSANLLYSGTDLTVYGITVGRGAGAVGTNTTVGILALTSNTSGALNTAVGNNALRLNTTGDSNTAFGQSAMYASTTGSYNTAVGVLALTNNTTASNNTAVGYQAAYSTTTGNVTAIGHKALYSNTTGGGNVAVGGEQPGVQSAALQANTTGIRNTAMGVGALTSNTTANENTAFGFNAMALNTTGASNTVVGAFAALGTTTGSNNTAMGWYALYSNTTANNNTAVGYQAGYSNTTGRILAVGFQALYNNTTGYANHAIGSGALYTNTTGNNNIAFGGTNAVDAGAALAANTTGSQNIAIGVGALNANTTASNNTVVGHEAGVTQTTAGGGFNTYIGRRSGYLGTGYQNTYVGGNSGFSSTGDNNTFIGTNAGETMTSGRNNTILGRYSGNQGGLDIRGSNNYIVLSDGDGNPRLIGNASGHFGLKVNPNGSWPASWSVLEWAGGNNVWGVQGQMQVGYNNYYDGTNYRFSGTGNRAGRTILTDAGFFVESSPTGNANATITFETQLNIGYQTTLALRGATPQAGTGITFPATQSASSNANTLDDYEEGDWTPTIASSGTQPTVSSYSERYGSYVKVGRWVTLLCQIRATISNVGTGYPIVTGLPFAPDTGNGAATIGIQNLFDTKPSGISLAYWGGSQVIFETATWSASANGYITFTMSYRTAN